MVVDRQCMLRTTGISAARCSFRPSPKARSPTCARKLGIGARARSLTGSPRERGAISPFGWDAIDDEDTLLLAESREFKTLVLLAAYHASNLSAPTIGCPGMNGMPPYVLMYARRLREMTELHTTARPTC